MGLVVKWEEGGGYRECVFWVSVSLERLVKAVIINDHSLLVALKSYLKSRKTGQSRLSISAGRRSGMCQE
jgi:hypothetical protein